MPTVCRSGRPCAQGQGAGQHRAPARQVHEWTSRSHQERECKKMREFHIAWIRISTRRLLEATYKSHQQRMQEDARVPHRVD